MGITLVIVGGIVAVTAVASLFDYLGKRRKGAGADVQRRVQELEARIGGLEAATREWDERIAQLESDLSFVNRLIDDKRK